MRVVDARRILIKMLREQFTAQSTHHFRVQKAAFISVWPESEKACKLHEPIVAHAS